jgi:hypothetical protein
VGQCQASGFSRSRKQLNQSIKQTIVQASEGFHNPKPKHRTINRAIIKSLKEKQRSYVRGQTKPGHEIKAPDHVVTRSTVKDLPMYAMAQA